MTPSETVRINSKLETDTVCSLGNCYNPRSSQRFSIEKEKILFMFSHAVQFSFILTNVRGRKKDEIPEQLIRRPPGLNKNPFHPETESIRMSK